jgi:hypothetical protein
MKLHAIMTPALLEQETAESSLILLPLMSKPQHPKKKANHGKRPANSKLRKAKRHQVKT